MEGGETERGGEREMDQPRPRHDSLIRQRRERGNYSVRFSGLLYHYPACRPPLLRSFPLFLVSSALPSSRLMEQPMQIARVNRARDRRRWRRWGADNASILLSSSHQRRANVSAAAAGMSGCIHAKRGEGFRVS